MKKAAIFILLVGLVLFSSSLAFAAESGDHAEETSTYFGIPSGALKFLNLVVFLVFLGWVLKGPILSYFKERGEKIKADLEESRARQAKADSLAADIQARLDSIENEVASIIDRAKVDGEKQKNEIIAAAKGEAEKILASARGEIDSRVKVARQQLTEYAGELAAQKAHDMLVDAMSETDRRKVFNESVDSLVETNS